MVQSKLWEALRAFEPNTVYRMLPPKRLARAMEMFVGHKVQEFRWPVPPERLYAVFDSGDTHVQFSLRDGEIVALCNAEDGDRSRIREVAALMVLCHLLHGTTFGFGERANYGLLRKALFAPFDAGTVPAAGAGRQLMIVPLGNGTRFFLEYKEQGERSALWRGAQAPPELASLVMHYNLKVKDELAFLGWVRNGDADIEVALRETRLAGGAQHLGGLLPIRRAPVPPRRGCIEIHGSPREVRVLRKIEPDTGAAIPLGAALFLTTKDGGIGAVENVEEWAPAQHLFREQEADAFDLIRGDAATGSPMFNLASLSSRLSPATLDATRLFWEKQPVAAAPAEVELRVDIRRADDRFELDLWAEAGGAALPWPHFFEAIRTGAGDYSPTTRVHAARKRAERTEDAFHQLFYCEKSDDLERLVDDLRGETDLFPQELGEEVAYYLVHCHHRILGAEAQDRYLVATAQGWCLTPPALRRFGKLVALCRFLLGARADAAAYDDNSLSMLAPEERVAAGLPEFLAELAALGVRPTFADQPLRQKEIEVTVSARDDGELDWFALHPEIFCDSLRIPQERWEALLRGGLMEEADGGFSVLAPGSRMALSRLMELVGGSGKSPGKDTVRVPKHLMLDWIDLSRHGIRCELPPEAAELLGRLRNFSVLEPRPLPAGLKADLRPYQAWGYAWLAFLYEHRFGACLADDMGLGKTVQAIALLGAIREGLLQGTGQPHLVVVPPTLLFNWQQELEKFYPGLAIIEHAGADRRPDFAGADVVLTTYDIARRDIATLGRLGFDVVLFDEAQHLKNYHGARSQAARELQGRFRLCLTGTPMENHVGEYYSIMELALPGLLGARDKFVEEAGAGGESRGLRRARPFVLRRTKDKILLELPPKVESDITLDLGESQKEYYTRVVGEVRDEVLDAFAQQTASRAGIVALSALTRLRQICITPSILDPEHEEISPKLEYLADQLGELVEESHSALVFSQFVRALDRLGAVLTARGICFVRMDGKTPTPQRKTLVGDFQKGAGPGVFLISLKTGGAGLNLTRAGYVFHLDPWWNPAVENQASDRAHRIGQKQTVFVQRLIMRHTVEEKMMVLKNRKMQLFRQIMEGTEARAGKNLITREDLDYLLGT